MPSAINTIRRVSDSLKIELYDRVERRLYVRKYQTNYEGSTGQSFDKTTPQRLKQSIYMKSWKKKASQVDRIQAKAQELSRKFELYGPDGKIASIYEVEDLPDGFKAYVYRQYGSVKINKPDGTEWGMMSLEDYAKLRGKAITGFTKDDDSKNEQQREHKKSTTDERA